MLIVGDRDPTNDAGMSIIEVLVSMAIMSVVLVGLGQGLVLGIRMNVESKARLANLSVAKRVMESVKSQAQFSQSLFDAAGDNDNFNKIFYVDVNGYEIARETTTADGGSSPSPESNSIPADSAYQVVVAVTDWEDSAGDALNATDSEGELHVMVKVLTVTVQTAQSAILSNAANSAAAREVRMTVEMVRPAA